MSFNMDDIPRRTVVFKDSDGGGKYTVDIPPDSGQKTMCAILNQLKIQIREEDFKQYRFYIGNEEIRGSLSECLSEEQKEKKEKSLQVTYIEEVPFKVAPVTRCSSTMPGHAESVISAVFSPNSKVLATGSGDKTVRFWDTDSQTPLATANGHKHWVLCLAWAPDGNRIATGDKLGEIIIWNGQTAQVIGRLHGHKKWITCVAWEPYHKNNQCRRLASSSKDYDIRIWDTYTCQCIISLSGHVASVTCVRWGGAGLLYSGSQDRTLIVWKVDTNERKILKGHAHWVNTIALSTEWILKAGPFDPFSTTDKRDMQSIEKRYETVRSSGERLVSGSDDFTMILWNPEFTSNPVKRMTGHQQLINDVKFSPDGRLIASASFDKSIRLWNGMTGEFVGVLRGHVQPVYVLSWAADSRRLVSGSADSTMKVWLVSMKELEFDLPGHGDEVYAVDWSLDGTKVGSGGKDKKVRLWQS